MQLVIPYPIYTITSTIVGLLLVFRVNHSYLRYHEGRRAFGAVNRFARGLTRQVLAYRPTTNQGPADMMEWHRQTAKLLRILKVTGHIIRGHIEKLTDHTWAPEDEERLRQQLEPHLTTDEVMTVLGASHRGLHITYEMSSCLAAMQKAGVHDRWLVAMDAQIQGIQDSIAIAERIVRTPLPTAYSRHTSTILSAWLTFLPCVLYPFLGTYGTVPASVLIGFFILGTEDVGVQIEQPFYVLPTDSFADGVTVSVEQLMLSSTHEHGEFESTR